MKLPNGNQAEIPMEKLIGYCLNPEHSSGKHTALSSAMRYNINLEV
jgi:hypothetical protein